MTAYVQHRPLAHLVEGIRTFAGDVVGGCVVITHNSLALLGVTVAVAATLFASQPDLRQQAGTRLASWLGDRHAPPQAQPPTLPITSVAQVTPEPMPASPLRVEPLAVARATAADPQTLPREQARLTLWIARKYQVAPEPVAALVSGAYKAGQSSRIDPSLILAVMAVESSFNPFAQSTAGAQGLMQVMTRVHGEKYDDYGGNYAAFDPLSNLRVGVWVLRDCIDKMGSTAGGLRCYVGATHLKTDGGYVNKVMAEYARLQQVVAPSGGTVKYPSANNTTTTLDAPDPASPSLADQTAQTNQAPQPDRKTAPAAPTASIKPNTPNVAPAAVVAGLWYR